MEEFNKITNDSYIKINKDSSDNLLDNYSIDKNSLENSENISVSQSYSFSQDQNQEILINFIEAVKDNNIEFVRKACNENCELINRKDFEGIYPIQYAILTGNTEMIDTLINLGALTELVLEGIPCLHLSLSLSIFSSYRNKSIKCFLFLLSKNLGFNINKSSNPFECLDCDRLGRTLLHVIFQNDLYECLTEDIPLIKTKLLSSINNLFVKDFNGDTVINYVFIYNSKECFKALCRDYFDPIDLYNSIKINSNEDSFIEKCVLYNSIQIVQNLIILSFEFSALKDSLMEELIRAEDFYKTKQDDLILHNNNEMKISNTHKIYSILLKQLNKDCTITSDDLILTPPAINKTLITFNSNSYKHGEIPNENNPMLRAKRRQNLIENPDRLSVLLKPPFGIFLSDFFQNQCVIRESAFQASLADILRVHDYDYVVSIKTICEELKSKNKTGIYKYDQDTYINQHTWESSTHAAGCVLETVDAVMSCEFMAAQCLLRPPGHHVGFFGRVESPQHECPSSNGFCFLNNVAIGAAYCKYKYKTKRIAIVDFDVHHGNGTEEIIKCLNKLDINVKSKNQLCSISINKKITHPWLDFDDAKNVLFISLHGFDEECPAMFYPSSGSINDNTNKDSDIYPGGILNIPIGKSVRNSHSYRKHFRNKVTPRLYAFKPDVIFISAGFDGHENEEINSAYSRLNEHDYRWMTEEMMKFGNSSSHSAKVISVLEGGYNINAGVVSSFVQSIMTHVKFMNIGLNKNVESFKVLSKIKRKREYQRDLENFNSYKKFRNDVNSDENVFYKSKLRNKLDELINVEKKSNENNDVDVGLPNFFFQDNVVRDNDDFKEIPNFGIRDDDEKIFYPKNGQDYFMFDTDKSHNHLNIENDKENFIKINPIKDEISVFNKNINDDTDLYFNLNTDKKIIPLKVQTQENVNEIKVKNPAEETNQFEEIEVVMDEEEDFDHINVNK